MNWLYSSIIALICWGIWGVLAKLASRYMEWSQVFVISSIASLIATVAVFVFFKPQIDVSSPGFNYSLLAGAAGSLAVVAFFAALGTGKASIVVPLTALYPVITIILSYLILSERISPTRGVGILLALAAIIFLSIE